MHSLWIDEYAHLESPLHRMAVRLKLVLLLAVIFAFSLVQDLRLVPVMALVTAGLYAASRLPVKFLVGRLRYPGFFLLAMGVILPFFAGTTVIWQAGPLMLRQEGLLQFALIASRFACILTVGIVLFGTAPFLETIHAMRRLGLPPLLADMTLLSWRYLFEMGDMLGAMERAMRLRGFRASRFSGQGVRVLASLFGTLFVRSYEQADRVYSAMRLRGYGQRPAAESSQDAVPMTFSPNGSGGASAAPLLDVENLHFGYPDRPDVLRAVNLRIQPGERVGLIGPNGAGKTSLFLAITGLVRPAAGAVRLRGEALAPGRFHPAVGLVFQRADDQLFSPLVRDDVAFGPQNMGLPPEAVQQRVADALAVTGVGHLAGRPPHHLSGGEKRMVAIAGVLAMQPDLIIYDEPDANLDARARRRLIEFLQGAPQTMLIASHDLEFVLEVCTRVVVLDAGEIVADGAAAVVLGDAPLMEAHGLERPHSLVPHAVPHHHA